MTISPEIPQVSADTLKKCKDWLVKANKEWGGGGDGDPYGPDGVCKGATTDLEATRIREGHNACHSWVSAQFRLITSSSGYSWSNKYKAGARPFLTLTCHSRKRSKASQEATDAIILWMASDDSPFGQYILNRDDPESLTTGGAVLLCGPGGLTHAQAMWVCKVLRYSIEGQQALDTWKTLVDGGVAPLLALRVCNEISTLKGAAFTASSVSSHVSVFSGYFDVAADQVTGLLTATVNPDADCTQSVFTSAVKTTDKKKTKAEPLKQKIDNFCQPIEKSDGWGGFIRGSGASKEQLVASVLEWQEELGGEVKKGFFAKVAEKVSEYIPSRTTEYLDVDM